MAANDEAALSIHDADEDIQDDISAEKAKVQQIEVAKFELNRVDLDTMSREAITFKSRAMFRLSLCILVQGICTAAYAVDGSVTSGLSALPAFREQFNVGTSGSGIGIIVSAMAIGNAAASLFQFLSDIIGRRGVTFLGNAIMILGSVLQAVAPNSACFIVGRLIAGMGGSLSATVGPLYMSEIAPACYRGRIVGIFAACNNLGGILMSCLLLVGSYMPGNWSWRMPILVQLVPSLLVIILVYPLTPETPRYLVARGKIDKAKEIIAKYHTTNESIENPVVTLQIEQIQESLKRVDIKPWDYSTFWKSRSGRRRLWIIFLYSVFQQWNGTGLLGTYLPAVLDLVGITNAHSQLGINVGQSALSCVSILGGSSFIDKVRRRYLLMGSLFLYMFFFGLMTIWSGLFNEGIAKHAMGIMIVVTIYLFVLFGGLFITIVHNIYPNEVFHYNQRAKGMGLYSFFQNVLMFTVQYGGASALQTMQWKVYTLFIAVNGIMLVLSYFYFPEFRYLTLEEIDLVMETDIAPVKMSLKLQEAKIEKHKEERLATTTGAEV